MTTAAVSLPAGRSRRRSGLHRLGLILLAVCASLALAGRGAAQPPPPVVRAEPPPVRHRTRLDHGWRTLELKTGAPAPRGVESPGFDDRSWRVVDAPHNWDEYEGARQVRHGDLHGTAWYRRTFHVPAAERGRRIFLYFEGVGSYATVWVNGREVGHHAGGLTTFTLDITNAVRTGADNLVVVRADHPAGIDDLPWVCGGCHLAYGFSEGTQPFGIFRPVHLITTNPVRIQPFGVHVWNDADVNPAAARVHLRTRIRNYGSLPRTVTLVTRILAAETRSAAGLDGAPARVGRAGPALSETRTVVTIAPGARTKIAQEPPPIRDAQLWSPASPVLYTVESELVAGGRVLDRTFTTFGIRTIHWASPDGADGRLLVNGRPFFINGICDYEHNLGDNQAFTAEQVRARVREIEAAGFNAYRDAHYPHNLRFQRYWDADGLLWWPQFSAHIWFDNPTFRATFLRRLRDWIRERRNSPSVVLWGLQNESVLPTAFAEQCAAIIRRLDPTATSQRLITTCNGGTGTDWNVPQNWSGTYGGDPHAYAADLRRQHLVGEYGAWRSLGLHSEGGYQEHGPLSEDRETALLEMKVRLAESVRSEVAGHFLWLFQTHSNPGRDVGSHGEQLCDGIRPLDRISPANNKGLFTIWGEPTDAYQMYRGNYASPVTTPMVYIVSHTWPDRWTKPGRRSGIIVYSNCDQVELFNDLGGRSLGVRTRHGIGTHFEWDNVDVRTNVLYAEGRIDGKVVARDILLLHHLPAAPRFAAAERAQPDSLAPRPGQTYLFRVNCGGPDYVDHDGDRWQADHNYRAGDAWGSLSWADAYPNLSPRFGSQRKIYDPVTGTRDPALYQTFRYGRDQLRYRFNVPDGDYHVELYFIEPWYGDRNRLALLPASETRGAPELDCTGWRLFDVAVNGRTVLPNLDLWREAGRAAAVKKVIPVHVTGGRIEISFPRVAAGQAVISAIAISTATGSPASRWRPAPVPRLVEDLKVADAAHRPACAIEHALDTGDPTYGDRAGGFTSLPLDLLEADWIRTADASRRRPSGPLLRFTVTANATVFVAHADGAGSHPRWLGTWDRASSTVATNAAPGVTFALYRRDVRAGTVISLGANTPSGDPAVPMYSVFVVPRRPAPAPQVVSDVRGANGNAGVRAIGNLLAGREVYGDAETRIAKLPGDLFDCDLVSPPQQGPGGVAFSVAANVKVYVALDPRMTTRPAWLSGWVPERGKITTTDRSLPPFVLVSHRFTPGQRVTLGANGTLPSGAPAGMYFAIVRVVRPAELLPAKDAALTGATAVAAAGANGGTAVRLPPGAGHAIAWTVRVGVGDRYGLDFRYRAAVATPAIPATLTIIGSDGRVLRHDKLMFPALSHPDAWSDLRTKTGSSINAGTYTFRLELGGNTPLIIDSLEVE